MIDTAIGQDISRLRQRVREIEQQMRKIRTEDRLFQRYGFGSDVHDIQLTALRAERRELAGELERLCVVRGLGGPSRRGLGSWLMLPAAFGALLIGAIRPRRQRRRPRPVFAD
jgi:hypothetical protein